MIRLFILISSALFTVSCGPKVSVGDCYQNKYYDVFKVSRVGEFSIELRGKISTYVVPYAFLKNFDRVDCFQYFEEQK